MFQDVMRLQPFYSPEKETTEMVKRQGILKDAENLIKDWLTQMDVSALGFPNGLEAKKGGQMAYFGLVPWIRIYSPEHSPTAQRGYYIVFLFSADGARFYLSLNQGTSESSGTPTKAKTVNERTHNARRQLAETFGEPILLTGQDMDLALEQVKKFNTKRARNYELGDVLSVEYKANGSASDSDVRAQLKAMLPLLANFYGVKPRPTQIRGSGGESQEHKDLKAVVAANPTLIDLKSNAIAEGKNIGILGAAEEYWFKTRLGTEVGDHVDVLFKGGGSEITVVEIEREGEEEVLVGVYQAIKYRALAAAQYGHNTVGPSTRIRAVVVAHKVDYPTVEKTASRYEIELYAIPRHQVELLLQR